MKRLYEFLKKYGPLLLAIILLAAVGIRYALPVMDGDLFWQMEYGHYLWENQTLIPDHTIYSWTPTDNDIIYCAWIGEIALYLLHEWGGLPLLFIFRYLCLLIVMGIIWLYAYRRNQGFSVSTFLVLLIVTVFSFTGAYLKPEIFSMVFMAVMSGLYFSVKSGSWGRWGTKPFLLYPLLFLVWVNTHGVFVFGLVALSSILFGEVLNYLFFRPNALSKLGLKHLTWGVFLSLLAILFTPYGLDYPLQLIATFTAGDSSLSTVEAYQSIFANPGFRKIWIYMLIAFTVLFFYNGWKRKKWDFALLFPTILLAFLSAKFLRSAYYWPSFWSMSIINLSGKSDVFCDIKSLKIRKFLNACVSFLFVILSVNVIYFSIFNPALQSWCGFGIGYLNPVQGCEFLRKNRPGNVLYNSYDVGGYLISNLYPLYKVACDPRYFPYKKWYKEYYEYNNGPAPLNEFQKKYPFDVAIVDFRTSESPILKFLRSPDWEPVFYGCASIVFVHKDVNFRYDYKELDNSRFDDLKNINQASGITLYAQNLGDLDASQYIIDLIKNKFNLMPGYDQIIRKCTAYQKGLEAFMKRDYEKALTILDKLGSKNYTPRANFFLIQLRNWKFKQLLQNNKTLKAFRMLEKNIRDRPTYIEALYNAGVIGYQLDLIQKAKQKPNRLTALDSRFQFAENSIHWREYLERFIRIAPDHKFAGIAKQALSGGGLPSNVELLN